MAAPDIVYCGGCNPQIDRGAIAREVGATAGCEVAPRAPAGAAPSGAAAPSRPPATNTVLLSGCARACASDHQLVDEAAGVVVAGEMVDGVATPAAAIAGAIAAAIARKMEGSPTPVKE